MEVVILLCALKNLSFLLFSVDFQRVFLLGNCSSQINWFVCIYLLTFEKKGKKSIKKYALEQENINIFVAIDPNSDGQNGYPD